MPFSEADSVDHPVSLYAATKRANELMAHSYSHLYNLPVTGLRFFTVYGPWGRPDQSLFLFVSAMLRNEPINVFNEGKMRRDFTYIDDIVEGVIRVLDKPATPDAGFDPQHPLPHTGRAPYRIFNIGNSDPVPLMDFITAIETSLGMTAQKNFLPLQAVTSRKPLPTPGRWTPGLASSRPRRCAMALAVLWIGTASTINARGLVVRYCHSLVI